MTVLPIVARELRVASRRSGTYWIRISAAVSVLLIGIWCFAMEQNLPPSELSVLLFGVMTGVALLFSVLSGVRYTADCLSEEKREGTLGLLFLTKLNGWDVVLGKLAASSLHTLYGVLAIVPMLALPLLLGGRSLGEVGRMTVVILNGFLFSLAIGICVSSLSVSGRGARGNTLAILFIFSALMPACGSWIDWMSLSRKPNLWSEALHAPSPFFAFTYGFDANYRGGGVLRFWGSVLATHCLAWLGLGLASWRTPRSWQQRPAGAARLRWRDRWRNWSCGDRERRVSLRRALLDINAFYWLAARARLKPALVWIFLALCGALWWCGWAKFQSQWLVEPVFLLTAGCLGLLFKAWFASEAALQFNEARQHQSLELLLSTPLSVREMLEGQRLALKRQFLAPAVVLSVVYLVFLISCIRGSEVAADRELWVLFWGGTILSLALDLAALFWLAVWRSLTAAHVNRAAGDALAIILLLPGGCMAVIALISGVLGTARGVEISGRSMLLIWFILGLATDIGVAAWARWKLLRNFRKIAAERFVKPVWFWRRWFGKTVGPG